MEDFNLLARDLCHVDKPRRDASLDKVNKLIANLKTPQEFKKCWKALYYCFWMSDKMLIQQELAEKLGLMMNEKIYYLAGFWDIIAKEWHGIDRLRLNKFYYLIRTMHKATFNWIKSCNYDLDVISQILSVLAEGPLNANDSKVPDGLRYHTIEVFFTILHQVEEKPEISLPAFKLLFSPFISLLQKTSNLNIVSHIMEDILDVYTKSDSEMHEWLTTICPAKEMSELMVNSLPNMPSKNKKMVQEYLTKWGSAVGIPFVNQVIVTGMDVKKVFNGGVEVLNGATKREALSTTKLSSKKQKLDHSKKLEKSASAPKKKKELLSKKVKNVVAEDGSVPVASKIPVPALADANAQVKDSSNNSKFKGVEKVASVEAVEKIAVQSPVKKSPKKAKNMDSEKSAPIEAMENASNQSPKTAKIDKEEIALSKKSPISSKKNKPVEKAEAVKSPKQDANLETVVVGEEKIKKSPKSPEKESKSIESFESFTDLAEAPNTNAKESNRSSRSRNLATTIPADTIALLRKTLKPKKLKKKTSTKSKAELQFEQLAEESGFQSDTLEPVSVKKSKIIQELQETQSSPIPKKSVSWGPSDVKAFKKHETICSNEQAQHSPAITSYAPTILKAFEKPLIQEFTVPAKKSKRIQKGRKKGRK